MISKLKISIKIIYLGLKYKAQLRKKPQLFIYWYYIFTMNENGKFSSEMMLKKPQNHSLSFQILDTKMGKLKSSPFLWQPSFWLQKAYIVWLQLPVLLYIARAT